MLSLNRQSNKKRFTHTGQVVSTFSVTYKDAVCDWWRNNFFSMSLTLAGQGALTLVYQCKQTKQNNIVVHINSY